MTSPALPATRIADVDALRGCALFGILMVNITVFATGWYGAGVADPAFDGPLDRAVRFGVAMLFETKFYLLFSFLFGYSFTLQMQAAERAGAAFRPRMLRRQAGLWLIGLLHALLLFHGDILTTYAVLGLPLLALRARPEAGLLKLAAALVLGAALCWGALGVAQWLFPSPYDPAAALAKVNASLRGYLDTPAGVVVQHVREMSEMWVVLGLLQGPCAFAMFLLGLCAGRRELLVDVDAHLPLLRRALAVGLAIGLPCAALYGYSAVYAPGARWELPGLALDLLTAPLLSAAYLAGALLLLRSAPGRFAARALADAGRMALSNYLLQSLACALLFYAYGLRLMGHTAPLSNALLACLIFAAQLALSRWWMGRHAYGPVEWVLRAITIGAWPGWRKRPAGAARASTG